MARGHIFNGGGGGVASDDAELTAYRAQVLKGYYTITKDSNDEIVEGTIDTQDNSGDIILSPAQASVSYPAGYYPNAHGASIDLQTKSVEASTSEVVVTPDDGKTLEKVNIAAIDITVPSAGQIISGANVEVKSGDTVLSSVGGTIPTKTDSTTITLDTSTNNQSKTYVAGYYPNAHAVQISLETKSVTPNTSAQNVTPSSGKVLSKVTVGAIPNQKTDSGNVTLNASTTSKSYAAGYYPNAHGAYVDVFTW